MRFRADAVLVLVALGWGASFVVIKDALGHVGAHGLLAARFGLATLALVVLFPGTLRTLDRRTLGAGAALGGVLWAAFALQTLGLVHTTPAKSAFLTAVYVPMTPVLARLLFGVRLRMAALASVVAASAGLALLLRPGDLGAFNPGDLLTLGCAVGFALHIVLLDRLAPRLPARLLAILQLGVVGVVSLPVAIASETAPAGVTLSLAMAVVYLALVCSAFAYVAQTWAQRHTPASRVAVIFALESVFAAAFSVGLGVEHLGATEWLGGALVVSGVLAGSLGSVRKISENS